MSNIIDFAIEQAYRKSGIKDRAIIQDIITQGYNPCNPDDIEQYYKWNGFLSIVQTSDQIDHDYWTEESLARIWQDMQNSNSNQTHTISCNFDSLWNDDDEINIDLNIDLNIDFEYKFDTLDKDE
jgi:hypothetical protein